jgi:hypothetical protein
MRNDIENLEAAFMLVLKHGVTKDTTPEAVAAFDRVEEFIDRFKKPEERLRAAREVMREDYEGDVGVIADDVAGEAQRMVNDDERDRDKLIEYLDQSVDGSGRVIYTLQAQEGLASSQNQDAYFEETGESLDEPNWMKLMYHALHADVIAELEDRGIDMNRPFDGLHAEEAETAQGGES